MDLSHILFFSLGLAVTACGLWAHDKYKNGKPKRERIIENIGPDAPRVFLACRLESYTLSSDGVVLTVWVDDEYFKIKTSYEVMKQFPINTSVVLQLMKLEEVKK